MQANEAVATVVRQLREAVRDVQETDLGKPTPCTEWTVSDLLGHLMVATENFTRIARGDEADWGAKAPQVDDPVAALDERLEALLSAVESAGPQSTLGFAVPEFAIHSWDVATAVGRGTDDFDQQVAQETRDYMAAALAEHGRQSAFGPEQPAPSGGNAYDALAAFAGRRVLPG